MSQQLSDEMLNQIDDEARKFGYCDPDQPASYNPDYETGFRAGASRYALHCEQLAAALEACINYMNNGQTEFHSVLDNAEEALSNYNQLIKKV